MVVENEGYTQSLLSLVSCVVELLVAKARWEATVSRLLDSLQHLQKTLLQAMEVG